MAHVLLSQKEGGREAVLVRALQKLVVVCMVPGGDEELFQRAPEGLHLHQGRAGPTSSYQHCFAQSIFFLVPVIALKI